MFNSERRKQLKCRDRTIVNLYVKARHDIPFTGFNLFFASFLSFFYFFFSDKIGLPTYAMVAIIIGGGALTLRIEYLPPDRMPLYGRTVPLGVGSCRANPGSGVWGGGEKTTIF